MWTAIGIIVGIGVGIVIGVILVFRIVVNPMLKGSEEVLKTFWNR